MTTCSFPSDPSCRRAILVLTQHDIANCRIDPIAVKVLRDYEAYVLTYPIRVQGEAPSALQNIRAANLARPGVILVQSPFNPDAYEEASVASQRFALAKHMYFSMLCMHLGAKEVSVEQVELRTSTGKTTLDLKAERAGASVQGNIASEELKKFSDQMRLCDVFAGSPADLDKAETLLHKTGLWSDNNMRSLLEMRRDGENQLLTRKLVLSLSSEAKSNLNVVGRLNMPAFVNFSADYKKVVQEQYDYTLTVLVRF